MATGILRLFSWNFPLFSENPTAPPSSNPPIFKFKRISVLGNPLGTVPNVIAIGVDFRLQNDRFVARFPLVNLTVSYVSTRLLFVTMQPLSLVPGTIDYTAEIWIYSQNPNEIQQMVDDSWMGSSVALGVVGPVEYASLNAIQKVPLFDDLFFVV